MSKIKLPKDAFFTRKQEDFIGLTYDDVLMIPGHSDVNPEDADLRSMVSRNVPVLLPISSSPMNTVTRFKMAGAMPRSGGIAILDPSLTKEEQKAIVHGVKYQLNWLIDDPITIPNTWNMGALLRMVEEKGYNFRSFPVLDTDGKFVGLVTGNHFLFNSRNPRRSIRTIMNKEVVVAHPGTSIHKARRIMARNNVKVLPLVDQDHKLAGMYTWEDVERFFDESGKIHRFNVDDNGNLRVGVAVGLLEDAFERADFLMRSKKRPDLFVVDTSHGHKTIIVDTIREMKRQWPDADVVAGNVATAEAAKYLADAGADGIRVGFGPGSICTTRIITGTGVPQVTAVYECANVLRGSGIPVIADGGIKYPGDIGKAIGAGASTVMLGGMLAGTEEAPGEEKTIGGVRYKVYMGMGSEKNLRTRQASQRRYDQKKGRPIVPEGVEGRVVYIGHVAKLMDQLEGALRATMKNVGAMTIAELQSKAMFTQVLVAGMKEAHPSVEGVEETSNYKPGK